MDDDVADDNRPLDDGGRCEEGSLFDDETTITEITIAPDGRVFTFGTSRAVVELLHELRPDDAKVAAILRQLKAGSSAGQATGRGHPG